MAVVAGVEDEGGRAALVELADDLDAIPQAQVVIDQESIVAAGLDPGAAFLIGGGPIELDALPIGAGQHLADDQVIFPVILDIEDLPRISRASVHRRPPTRLNPLWHTWG